MSRLQSSFEETLGSFQDKRLFAYQHCCLRYDKQLEDIRHAWAMSKGVLLVPTVVFNLTNSFRRLDTHGPCPKGLVDQHCCLSV